MALTASPKRAVIAIMKPDTPMHILSTLRLRIFEFGWLGWIEIFAASLVAIGCMGEFWILLNKLTRHIEPLPKSVGPGWKLLAWIDVTIRPIAVRLKIRGRKLSESKEQLLERSFVMLVAFGVGVEFVCLMFSLHEVAKLNEKADLAEERTTNAMVELAQLTKANLLLQLSVTNLNKATAPREIPTSMPKELSDILRTNGVTLMLITSSEDEKDSVADDLTLLFWSSGINLLDSRGDNRAGLEPFPDAIGHNERLAQLIRLRMRLPPVDCGIRVESWNPSPSLQDPKAKEVVKSAYAIVNWLNSNKIDAQYKGFDDVPTGQIVIRIGPKPNPVKR